MNLNIVLSATIDDDGNYSIFNQDQKNDWYIFKFNQKKEYFKIVKNTS